MAAPRMPLAGALLMAFLFLSIAARGEIVDRIAVVAGDKIITASEIDERIRLTAFQNRESPDFSLESRQRAVRELIDQRLIEHEMDVGRYPRLDADRKKTLLTDFEKAEYKSDPAALAKALAVYGLIPKDLEDDLGRETDLLTFLNLRFRPAVQVTDQDVRKYFAAIVPAGADKTSQDAEAGALNEMRAEIEQKLTVERADKELNLWLQDQRKRTKIEYLEKDLESDKK
jgi:parvulin-like peptidyl-prolyl isomerase